MYPECSWSHGCFVSSLVCEHFSRCSKFTGQQNPAEAPSLLRTSAKSCLIDCIIVKGETSDPCGIPSHQIIAINYTPFLRVYQTATIHFACTRAKRFKMTPNTSFWESIFREDNGKRLAFWHTFYCGNSAFFFLFVHESVCDNSRHKIQWGENNR